MSVEPSLPPKLGAEPAGRRRPDVADSLVELVGNTPLLRLGSIAEHVRPTVYVKLEYLNPGGSVKDRPAFAMIAAAEREGTLKPGGTIVEATAGNTGAGLVIAAAGKGYRCIFVVSDKVSTEKRTLLHALGAEVVVAPYNVAPEDPHSYYCVADRLVAEIPGAIKLDQYRNPANPGAHVRSTGPEIWDQTGGAITHFVAGIGTGGTLCGTAGYLKSRNPDVQAVGVEPVGSVFSGGPARPYLVEGVGEDFRPANFDDAVVDRIIQVDDAASFRAARALARTQGALTGGSSGAAVVGALRLAEDLDEDAVIVALLPDSGRGYLSRFYDDRWMIDHGFLRREGPVVADLLASTGAAVDPIAVSPNETLRHVVATLRRSRARRVYLAETVPPRLIGDISGILDAGAAVDAARRRPQTLDAPVNALDAVQPPDVVGIGEALTIAADRLAAVDELLVLDEGAIAGLITGADLIGFRSSGCDTVALGNR